MAKNRPRTRSRPKRQQARRTPQGAFAFAWRYLSPETRAALRGIYPDTRVHHVSELEKEAPCL